MPQTVLNDVTLAFTNNMMIESEYGGWNYSVIVDRKTLCDTVRKTVATQKQQRWPMEKNTDEFIIAKLNAKSKDEVAFEPVKEMMLDSDVLLTVKSKQHPIENTTGKTLGRGSIVDVIVDFFEFEYGKRQFICARAHSEQGLTVKVKTLIENTGGIQYFTSTTQDTPEKLADIIPLECITPF